MGWSARGYRDSAGRPPRTGSPRMEPNPFLCRIAVLPSEMKWLEYSGTCSARHARRLPIRVGAAPQERHLVAADEQIGERALIVEAAVLEDDDVVGAAHR